MNGEITEVDTEKDIRMTTDKTLSFSVHLAEKLNKANRLVGLIRRTFVSLNVEIFKNIFISLVRPLRICEPSLDTLIN